MNGYGTGSSRAKGKQRAREDDNDGDERDIGDRDGSIGGMDVSIRFTDGTTEDLDMFVNESESVREMKRRIRLLRPPLATNRLRLIYLGRIITDGTRLVPWLVALFQKQQEQQVDESRGSVLESIEGAVKHALGDDSTSHYISGKGKPSLHSRQSSLDAKRGKDKGKAREVDERKENHPAAGRKIWLHCSVGEPGSYDKDAETAPEVRQPSVMANQQPVAGFDRLREAGFSEDEIANMRAQFHADGPGDTVVAGDDDEHARALEEQWMEGLGAGGNELNPSSGMYVTLFKGVIAGFFLPFLPLFFFRAESAVFTKQMQMAIIAGCAVNVLYGALRAFA